MRNEAYLRAMASELLGALPSDDPWMSAGEIARAFRCRKRYMASALDGAEWSATAPPGWTRTEEATIGRWRILRTGKPWLYRVKEGTYATLTTGTD